MPSKNVYSVKPINGWTKQSIINFVNKNFKGKSVTDDNLTCKYRGPKEKRCAVGLFIPDEMYSPHMEGRGLQTLMFFGPDLEKFMPLPIDAMGKLQVIHDCSHSSTTKKDMLNWIKENVAKGEKP